MYFYKNKGNAHYNTLAFIYLGDIPDSEFTNSKHKS